HGLRPIRLWAVRTLRRSGDVRRGRRGDRDPRQQRPAGARYGRHPWVRSDEQRRHHPARRLAAVGHTRDDQLLNPSSPLGRFEEAAPLLTLTPKWWRGVVRPGTKERV